MGTLWGGGIGAAIVRTWAASPSSHERTGTVSVIRPCVASQASSYHETSATRSSSEFRMAAVAAPLMRLSSSDHQ
jgi:hypothetical protein